MFKLTNASTPSAHELRRQVRKEGEEEKFAADAATNITDLKGCGKTGLLLQLRQWPLW